MGSPPKLANQCWQCWAVKPPEDFIGRKGGRVRMCAACRDRYYDWGKKSAAEKAAVHRHGVPESGALRARLFVRSGNRKLGGIPSSITSRDTCPNACSFYEAGCYAEYHVLAYHWRQVGAKGDSWEDFCAQVAALPKEQLWRHNVAGDLPGVGDRIHAAKLAQLVEANRGRRGFTFTHKHLVTTDRDAIARANTRGFTVNMSADSLREADRLAEFDAGPVAVVLPSDVSDEAFRTPRGRQVVVCPAQTAAGLTCASCRLCSHADRRSIVGFRAHGQSVAQVDSLVRLRRSRSEAPGGNLSP